MKPSPPFCELCRIHHHQPFPTPARTYKPRHKARASFEGARA